MKISTAAAIFQVFLLVAAAKSTPPVDGKQVVCFYITPQSGLNGTLNIENIDASICTHLLVDEKVKGQIVEEYFDAQYDSKSNSSSEGMLQKFHRLRDVNPDLKLIVQIRYWYLTWIKNIWDPSAEPNVTHDSVRLLKEMGFDGFDFDIDSFPQETLDNMTNVFCDLKTEFDKHGFIITTSLTERRVPSPESPEIDYSRVASCSDHVRIFNLQYPVNVTRRLTTLSAIKTAVNYYNNRGIPFDKMVIAVPSFGNILTLDDPEDTGLGAKIHLDRSPQIGPSFQPGLIFYKDILQLMQNSSFDWTLNRDKETREPYAFSNTGLWLSYEDRESMKIKANYVQEKGLRGLAIFPINVEDSEGIGEGGRFPLTRAVYNAFQGEHQLEDNAL